MAKFLSAEYFELQKQLAESQPERPGASVKMQNVVTGGPEGDVRHFAHIENGKLLDAGLGDLEGADVTLTQDYDTAVKVTKGELDANAAFMQGKVKVAGNMAKLMALMPLSASPEYKQVQQDLLAQTEF